jgi:4-hydroxy 2-oxovalerate aldolase
VIAYAMAVATSGQAARIFLAGFDGYGADDPRTAEMDGMLNDYQNTAGALPIQSITPTRYKIPATSVYAMLPANG